MAPQAGARRLAAIVAAGGLLLGACSSGGSNGGAAADAEDATTTTVARTTTTLFPPATPDDFTEATCPMEVPEGVEVDCGYLTVPENREDPDSRMIKLAVARIHSKASSPRPDPVVQLEGGPGFASLADVAAYAESSVLEERDLIIWDQRGLGFSTPNLDCPETDEAVWSSFATPDSAEVEGAKIEEGMRACRKRLVDAGVDLDGYDTIQNAADLADLRRALDIDEWNLRGVSYGSALAIETVRNHPEGIHSVLLDSVVVPDEPFGAVARGESALRAYDELAKACADDDACKAKYGSTTDLIRKVAARFDAEPYETTVEDQQGKTRTVRLTGGDIYAGVFRAMYDEALIPILPSALTQILDGNTAIVDQIAQEGIPFVTDQHEAMTTSVDCADRERLLSEDRLEEFLAQHPEMGALVALGAPESGCAEWDVEPNPQSFNTLLTRETSHDVPILVMAGRFDPITPPAGTQRVAAELGTTALLFPNAGHGGVGSSDCARQIYVDFMDDPGVGEAGIPDTTECMDDLGPPQFA